MKDSLVIILFFLAGIGAGIMFDMPDSLEMEKTIDIALYALLLVVGINLGADPGFLQIIRSIRPRIFFIPLATILGTLLGVTVYHILFDYLPFNKSVAVGMGFGYYSLSSVILNQLDGEELGLIALMANISREVLTLLFAPFFARFTGKLAPVVAGGATSMDTTLPVIIEASGKRFLIHAMIHGVVLSILVPVLVTLAYQLL